MPAAIYEFGPFRLDTEAHLLLKGNTRVNLTPKSFDLLQVLIENAGRALRKSEILEAVWPDTQVEEGNLTFQVSALRKVLSPEACSWIESVPRYGYRWSAPVIVHPVAQGLVRATTADVIPGHRIKIHADGPPRRAPGFWTRARSWITALRITALALALARAIEFLSP